MEHIHALSRKVYSEPTSVELKPYILEYIRYYIDQAKNASDRELTHGRTGSEVSSRICGALAWQGAASTPADSWVAEWINRGSTLQHRANSHSNDTDWITEKDEPILWKMLDVSCILDADTDNLPAWRELLSLAEQL